MSSKSKSKQEEALQFLDDLNSLTPPSQPPRRSPSSSGPAAGEAEALAFLEEITQKSAEPTRTSTSHLERPLSRSGTPTLRKSTERVKLGGASPLLPSGSSGSISRANSAGPDQSAGKQQQSSNSAQAGGAWGWGSVWSSASAAIQQAKSVVDEQVKAIPVNEQARKWGEGVISYAKTAQLDKISQDFRRVGLSTLTDILNVVAPPISEHEVIHVWLTHDMRGYEGVESLTYRALARIMEQVEGGDLVVNRGEESRPKDGLKGERDLNAVDGYEAALKMAQANIAELIKKKAEVPPPKPSSLEAPTTYSHIYLRVQPFFTSLQVPSPPLSDEEQSTPQLQPQESLQFLLHLVDPAHKLSHTTVTQVIPTAWLDIWDQYDWVEDSVAEVIRVGVEVLGQQYVVARMGWIKSKEKESREAEEEEEEEEDEEDEEEEDEEDASDDGKNA
ncbi:hypothetical protein BDN72DRAFT_783361 [Pluteus cervinus]|uniref:Uncharacterized protein n=1 Tax=Pluteus cervinus TaxID=181527 RepID=A0ACD3BGQ4_9AGAR|nr:hypothetical protein BDN72DRAFT_783361 [Pluteus cervinus]